VGILNIPVSLTDRKGKGKRTRHTSFYWERPVRENVHHTGTNTTRAHRGLVFRLHGRGKRRGSRLEITQRKEIEFMGRKTRNRRPVQGGENATMRLPGCRFQTELLKTKWARPEQRREVVEKCNEAKKIISGEGGCWGEKGATNH